MPKHGEVIKHGPLLIPREQRFVRGDGQEYVAMWSDETVEHVIWCEHCREGKRSTGMNAFITMIAGADGECPDCGALWAG